MNPGLGAVRPAALIAIVGAESCGKSTLARTLTARLRADGLEAVCVDEYLREFCEQHGRTPRPDEQAAIAAEQGRRIEAARRSRLLPVDVVVADTTALMTAVYSEMIFGDRSLHEDALAARAGGLLTNPPAPPATLPYTLHAMQQATLDLYRSLVAA